jgi:ubiquinol-cytochrome c reductase cytochrome c subunit
MSDPTSPDSDLPNIADLSQTEGTSVNEELDTDAGQELGFEPSASATGADPEVRRPRGRRKTGSPGARPRRTLGRRIGAVGVLIGALASMGAGYAAFASNSGAAAGVSAAQQAAQGQQLYEVSCITCHGANLQGVKDRGPALNGVGGAAAYFQVSTGRMPATGQGANESRKTAKFTDAQAQALAAYVQSIGGGPALPAGALENMQDLAEGGELFRLNCASCHGTTFKGAPLSAGKTAPSLNAATALQMYTAMLSGPESMPVFGDNQITPEQKKAIIAYVETIKASNDPGGSGIDRIGPVSEAIVLWVVGVGGLMIAILWIGAKVQ